MNRSKIQPTNNKPVLSIIKKIGKLPYTDKIYALCDDGNIWLFGASILNRSICDSYDDFMLNLDHYRVELF